MSTDLASIRLDTNISTQVYDDLQSLTQGAGFLKRIQLYSKGDAVNNKLIGIGEYGSPVNAKKIISFGDSMDVLVLAVRPKAIDMSDKEAIVTSYDPTSESFKEIRRIADSGVPNNGCQYGLEFLFIERTTGDFYSYLFGSKSTRPIAAEVYTFLPCSQERYDALKAAGKNVSQLTVQDPQPMTMKVEVVSNKKGSWHVPVIHPCSTPFENLPPAERIKQEIEKFTTEKGNGVEKAEKAETGRVR